MFGFSPFATTPFASIDVLVSTPSAGVVANGYVGTVLVGERLIELSGVSAAGSTGILGKTNSPQLVGVQASGELGQPYLRFWTAIDQGVTTTWTLINTD